MEKYDILYKPRFKLRSIVKRVIITYFHAFLYESNYYFCEQIN